MFISDHITSRIQIYRYLLKVSFLATALLSILSFHWNFHDGQIVEKWIWSGITFCITIFLITLFSLSIHKENGRLNNCIEIMAYTFLLAGLVVIIQSLLQVTGITSVNNTTEHRIIAGFDNPAGVAASLTVSFPFTLALIDKVNNRILKFLIICGLWSVVLSILFIASSRVGILATGTIMLLYVIHTIKDNTASRIVVIFLFLLLLTLIIYMSFSKRGSNSGRALILGVCWDMFKDAPLFGHGLHGFRSQYMLYQAKYLDQCTSNVLPMLADNVTHPLNEYVLLAVNFGLIGITVLLSGVIVTIIHYFKNPSNESFVGMMAIVGIGVLSMFSYPFRYPLTVLGLLCALLLVYKDIFGHLGQRTVVILRIIMMIFSVSGLCFILLWTRYQVQWRKLSTTTDVGDDIRTNHNGYENLYPKLKKDPYFLYNYAYVLSENGDCEKAVYIATESFRLMSNYDTALLIADNVKECGDVNVAEEYYKLASRMCPVRFLPLYGLFRLYEELEQFDKMKKMGNYIISKPVKVNSFEIRQIKLYVRQALFKTNIKIVN